ncbi:hypothetical protein FACS189434_09190 [Bacteroidia bacterium]|nr:hypothetical protein FACS189434_09190 [Bacteroidia bacterium]
MNEKQLQLVTFEQAVKIKELGFNCEVPTTDCYNKSGKFVEIYEDFSAPFFENHNSEENYYSAPTVALALKWFRDAKNIFSTVEFTTETFKKGYFGKYFSFEDRNVNGSTFDKLKSNYEDAESALLDELINILKSK